VKHAVTECLGTSERAREEKAGIAVSGGNATQDALDIMRSEIAPNLPALRGDSRLVKQIALNLLSNAVKFTPAGGFVTVSAKLDDAAIVLRVADTGIGIPADELAKVTKPFYQIDSGMTRKREGTGLGLALVAAYAKLHEAELRLDSAVGHGTVVTLRFPQNRTLADKPQQPSSETPLRRMLSAKG
jgi:signal transduction histidine kinase